ncbi:MAG: flagellar filament capping protein FliD [Bdellovibrionales bacterium]|nr:flagellar filament capping protein FliD [Bdellovibrionales bacterium]
MPPIRFGGLASGLPPNIVEQIMASERIPVQNMEAKKTNINTKFDLVTDLESKVRKMREDIQKLFGTKGFQDYSLKTSREGIVAGAVDPEQAVTGNWALEVVRMPQSAGRLTNGFPDKDRTQVGVGYLKFSGPDGDEEVYINDGNNTLQGIANAVNQANFGIRASVIKDADQGDYPYKIIFTSEKYGDGNNVEFPRVYLLDGDHDFYFDEEREAHNGLIKVNGFEVEVDDRKLKDLIPGVTLDLLSADPGKEVVVSVNEDYEIIKGKIGDFVGSINAVLGFIQTQNKMDQNTDTSKTLGGDSMLRSVEMRLRSTLQGGNYSFGPGINRLSQLGVEFNRNGTLDFNQEKFDKVLRSKPQEVISFFRGNGGRGEGFIGKIQATVDNFLQSTFGVISNRKRGLQNQIKRIDERIESKERLLARKEQNLRQKFSKLEETMGALKAQGSAVSAAVGSLGTGISLP